MKFVIRVKHFDVSIINRTENMTSVDCITQLGNEFEVNRKKGDPQLKEQPRPEVQLSSWKTVCKTFIQTIIVFLYFQSY